MKITSVLCSIILPSVACLAVPHFAPYLLNGMTFGKNIPEHDFLYNLCLKHLIILRRIQ
jgi:uncharacterized membrane protein YqaE (UPF0057 family)